jgi:hypothetical protein
MKVYIIGKVTGLDYEHCCDLFEERQKELEEQGHRVVNPVRIVQEGTEWATAMKTCLHELIECQAYSTLGNALTSKGSMLELFVARELKIPEVN